MALSAGPSGLKFLNIIVARNSVIASSIMSIASSVFWAGPVEFPCRGIIGKPQAISMSLALQKLEWYVTRDDS